jgi:hypothetical protein
MTAAETQQLAILDTAQANAWRTADAIFPPLAVRQGPTLGRWLDAIADAYTATAHHRRFAAQLAYNYPTERHPV